MIESTKMTPERWRSEFPPRLRGLRLKKKYTQKRIACLTGVSVDAISWLESGHRLPSLKLLVRLADVFRCPVDYLLGRIRSPRAKTLLIYPEKEQEESVPEVQVEIESPEESLPREDKTSLRGSSGARQWRPL